MVETQTVKVQHGCGCLSALGTFALAFLGFRACTADTSESRSLSDWYQRNEGLAMLAFLALLVGFLVWGRVAAKRRAAQPVKPTRQIEVARHCPDCGEAVQVSARICRFCRHSFT